MPKIKIKQIKSPIGRKSIQKKGISPDIIVEEAKIEKVEKRDGGRESDLKGALDNPNLELDKKNNDNKNEEVSINDFQLSRALDLVRGISLYKNKLAVN